MADEVAVAGKRSNVDTGGESRPVQRDTAPRVRNSRLIDAARRINGTLNTATVLEEVLESARSLTGARYGVILTYDGYGAVKDVFTSGMTAEEESSLEYLPSGKGLLGYLNETTAPLRLANVSAHPRSVGFPDNHPPMNTFLGMQIRHGETHLGNIFLTEKEFGQEFTEDDEETIALLVALAAVAIQNARTHESERRARRDLETLLDIVPVGVMVFDAKTGRLLSSNAEVKRLVGDEAETPWEESMALWTFHRADGRLIPASELPLNRVFQFGETVRGEDIVANLPDGRTYSTMVHAAPIFSEQGELTAAIVVSQDLTPLVDSERVRSEFLGLVSEELRMPLATIKGSIATLSDLANSYGQSEGNQLLKIIDQQIDLMRGQVNSLVELSYIETGSLSVSPVPTSAESLVNEAVRDFLRGRLRRDVQISLPDALPQVMADRQRIGQVLNNLLFSVDRHAPDASSITISASQSDIYVAISVSAEMGGVADGEPTELLHRILGPDVNNVGKVTGGEKLALDLCRGVVEAHGGRLHAENEDRKNRISYTCTIPATEEQAVEESAEAVNDTGPQETDWNGLTVGEKGRVIVASEDVRMMGPVRRTLAKAGYLPIPASDLNDLERCMNEEQPDLVLLDMSSRPAAGLELTRRLCSDYGVPVIVLSGQGEDENIERAFARGADDYIVKPFSPTELVARTTASLRKRSASRQAGSTQRYRFGEVTVDYAGHTVTVSGSSVHMTATEYQLLVELSSNAGQIVTQDELLKRVWGPEYTGESQLLRSYIRSLRQKLGDDAKSPSYIFTEHGIGYRMQKPQAIR